MSPKKLAHRFQQILNRDNHTKEILTGSIAALLVKVLASAATFLMNIVVARKLGTAEAGFFFLSMTIITLTASITRIGLDNTIVRFIATEQAAERPGSILSIYRQSIHLVCVSSILGMLLIIISIPILTNLFFGKPQLSTVLYSMALAIPLLALSTMHALALQGLRRVAQAMTIFSVSIPILLLTSLLAFPTNSAEQTGWIYSACCGITLLLGYYWWRSAAPYSFQAKQFARTELLASCLPLWGVMLLGQLIQWSSQLLLGAFGSSTEVALFATAQRTAMLTSFVLIAVNSIAAPKFAALHSQGNKEGLRRTAILSIRLMLMAAIPALAIILLFPEWLMSLFGDEFRAASKALIILAIGQFVSTATGAVSFLLSMSGHERLLRINMLISAILGIGLGALLIPNHGIIGAAIATSTAIAAQNLLGAFQVKRALGFNTLAFWRKM